MPEENLLTTLESSLRQCRATRSRLASRLAHLEIETERIEYEHTHGYPQGDYPYPTSYVIDLENEAERVRLELGEVDAIVSQTEATMFRILSSNYGVQASMMPRLTDAEIEAALRRDMEAERLSEEGHDAGHAPQPFDRPPVESAKPPARAQSFLLLLLDVRDRTVIVGDLTERYEVVFNERGKRRADLWFYYEVARSTWPFLRKLIARVRGRINSRSASA